MDARDVIKVGMSAERRLVVPRERTVGHFVPDMPLVYATPMMVLHMEMAAGSSIASSLPAGFVSVGMEVNIRHLAATPVGGAVRALAVVRSIEDLLPQLQANLPASVKLTVLTDRTTTIRASVKDVEFELVLTIGLVVMVIFVFLRNLSATNSGGSIQVFFTSTNPTASPIGGLISAASSTSAISRLANSNANCCTFAFARCGKSGR